MAQPDREIRRLLEQRLLSTPGMPVVGTRPLVAFENESFTPPDQGVWVRCVTQWADSAPEGIALGPNAPMVDRGNLLVDVFAPQDAGPAAADTLVAAVRQHFLGQVALSATDVTVIIDGATRDAGRQPQLGEPPYYFVPVTVRWHAHWVAG